MTARRTVNGATGVALIAVAALLAPVTPDQPLMAVTPSRAILWCMAAGFAVCGIIVITRRASTSAGNLALAIAVSVACLIGAEFALAAAGVQPERHIVQRVPPLAPGFEPGTERGTYLEAHYARVWTMNDDGFADPDAFDADVVKDVPRRVLLLGDSFAFGAAASAQEKGFAEILQRRLNERAPTVVWNTGRPGHGQEWEFECLDRYGPEMQPHIVVATLFRNDYRDNLYPRDQFYLFEGAGRVLRWERREDGALRPLSPEAAYRRAFAARWPHEFLKTTRTFTALTSLLRRLDRSQAEDAPPVAVREAGAWFERMQARCEELGARLVVLVIPDWRDTIAPGPAYQASKGLCGSLGLDCMDVLPRMAREDYAPPPDGHWLDSGHAKAAEALAEHLERLFPAAMTDYDGALSNGRPVDHGH